MNTRLTRRELAGAVLGAAAAPALSAAQAEAPRDEMAIARAGLRNNLDALKKFEVPITLEPSFTFRP
jgi:hypothetical protein